MELEFDKEIDALLRKAKRASPAVAGAPLGGHLDADQLAAFAENALPERTRQMYVAHLADCDTCRKTLSGFIAMTPELAASAAAFAPAPSAVSSKEQVPWYRRIFIMPNLAVTMGGLVVIFSGIIGLLVWQNGMGSRNAEVSQVADTRAVSNTTSAEPRFEPSTVDASAAANTAANANTSSPIESVTKSGVAVGSTNTSTVNPTAAEEQTAPSGDIAKNEAAPATAGAPLPPPKDAPAIAPKPDRDQTLEKEKLAKTEDKVSTESDTKARMDAQNNMREVSPGAKSVLKRAEGPRQAQTQSQPQFGNVPMQGRSLVTSIRSAGGKNFELRDGVWYDTSYTGQSKKDVKRGTEKYLRLDAGLRSIADQIGGTVVIVWGDKAYKIR